MTILHPETPVQQAFWQSIKDAAPRLGVEVTPGGVHDAFVYVAAEDVYRCPAGERLTYRFTGEENGKKLRH